MAGKARSSDSGVAVSCLCENTVRWLHFASPEQMDSSHESACEKAHIQGILSSYVPFLSVKIIFPELILKGNQHLSSMEISEVPGRIRAVCEQALGCFEAGLCCSGVVVMSSCYWICGDFVGSAKLKSHCCVLSILGVFLN